MLRPIIPAVQRALSHLLQQDPETLRDVAAMRGKVIAIELTGVDITVYAFPHEAGIDLSTEHHGETDVQISGTPLALLRMTSQRGDHTATFSGDVELKGDLALSQHLQGVIKRLEIDWEELLAKGVGDVAAHQFGNLIRGLHGWTRHVHKTLEMDIAEYARVEARLVPEHHEVAAFISSVDTLRSDADRLEKRLQRLRSRF